jgi:[pyruvate, water dikinase]-phosphate phosphotransferase / [pyruvate, water dikinase] kinase
MGRAIFYISDGTGISAETLGRSLITQFDAMHFHSTITLPYINSETKAIQAVNQINQAFGAENQRPIVFSTIVKPSIRNIIVKSNGFVIDFFQSFIGTLEQELKTEASPAVGLTHAVVDEEEYSTRIDAVNFALQCDDGVNIHAYKTADLILLGVSRTGKTPTCLYLALQHGIRAANYPLTPEDLQSTKLPEKLDSHRSRLFGLTILPERLHQMRTRRRADSDYAAISQCELEVNFAESLFQREKIPYLNSTNLSIEELSAHILVQAGLKR